MTEERRKGERVSLWFPMKLDHDQGEESVAVSRNVSERGVLMATAADLAEGTTVSVTFQPSRGSEERQVDAVIVRCESNDRDPDGLWPYRDAIAFADPLPDLADELRRLSSDESSDS